MIENNSEEISRLAWSCRRGMLELDVLLRNFLQNGYAFLTSSEKYFFEQLLKKNDVELFSC